MRILILAVVACVTAGLAAQALAAQRDTLSGFQNFRFGMNEQELRELVEIGEKRIRDNETELIPTERTIIDGTAYKLDFLLKENKLYYIGLLAEIKDPLTCVRRLERIFGLVKAKYGDPDDDPEYKNDRISETKSVSFTFQDGARIVISTLKLSSCLEMISYYAGSSGGTF